MGFFEGWVQVLLIILNLSITLLFILNDQFTTKKEIRSGFWRMVSIPITAIYFVECCFVIFTTQGSVILSEKKLYIIEILCQAVAVLAYVKLYGGNTEEAYAIGATYLSFSFVLRNLRITILLEEVKAFKVIMQMVMKMTVPILYMFAVLYIVFYVFAIIGMYGLGGVIRQPNFHSEDGSSNNLYYLINFNDLGSSIVTLYSFMIINNWPAITDMMCNTSGANWPRVYFMVFYIFVQWIILNIVIAMMLEIFDNVAGEMEEEFKHIANVKDLMKKQSELGNNRFEQLCDEVNEAIMKEEVNNSELCKRSLEKSSKKVSHTECA